MITLTLKKPPAPISAVRNGALQLTARSLKAILVIPPEQLAGIDPAATNGMAQVAVVIAVEGHGQLHAKLNPRSLRKALGAIAEHGAENAACILQGRLVGEEVTEAGLSVQPKTPRPGA